MKKLFSLFLILLFSASFVSANIGEIYNNLDFTSKIRSYFDFSNSLSLTGEQRQCSSIPDDYGIVNSGSKVISCNGQVALINFYTVNEDGTWNYLNEYQSPVSFSYGRKWAYECYYCPEVQYSQCNNGEKRCVSDEKYEYCDGSEQWQQRDCGVGYFCSKGSCVNSCDPSWQTQEWSECSNGKQIRNVFDSRHCNTDIGKPLSERACDISTGQPIDVPPPICDGVKCNISLWNYSIIGIVALILLLIFWTPIIQYIKRWI